VMGSPAVSAVLVAHFMPDAVHCYGGGIFIVNATLMGGRV